MHTVIVDQSRVVLKVLAGMLESRGHRVRAFADSREALAFITETPDVEVLISSLEVEPISGLELCWAARALAHERRPLWIVLMSSLRDDHKLGEALDSGADDFIGKPPNMEELHARLRAAERIMTMQRELLRLAETDPLSGILNRRAFSLRAKAEIERSRSTGDPLSLVMFDIDHFKRINDTYGHDVGDAVIQGVAREAAKLGTIVGRLGGEEFAIALSGADVSEAADIADGLRLACSELCFESRHKHVRLTCSFGVSGCEACDTLDVLLKKADLALYEAKVAGRNCIRLASALTLAEAV